jgi:hypothetical protein
MLSWRTKSERLPNPPTGRLAYPDGGGRVIWLCLEPASWIHMIDAQNLAAKGGRGAGGPIFRLTQSGKVQIVPVGTRVRVLETRLTSRRVELIETGQTGWIQREFVQSD